MKSFDGLESTERPSHNQAPLRVREPVFASDTHALEEFASKNKIQRVSVTEKPKKDLLRDLRGSISVVSTEKGAGNQGVESHDHHNGIEPNGARGLVPP